MNFFQVGWAVLSSRDLGAPVISVRCPLRLLAEFVLLLAYDPKLPLHSSLRQGKCRPRRTLLPPIRITLDSALPLPKLWHEVLSCHRHPRVRSTQTTDQSTTAATAVFGYVHAPVRADSGHQQEHRGAQAGIPREESEAIA